MDQSVCFLKLNWNEKRFQLSKSSRDAAKRSLYRATTTLIKSETKNFERQNEEIQHEIHRCYSDLRKYEEKSQTLENMTQLATESLENYFEKRMENLGAFVREQCRTISAAIEEEAEHWKEIHAMLQQKLVVPGDLRSYGGGNGLPRQVQQSPEVSRIVEEDEEEEKEEEKTIIEPSPLVFERFRHGRTLTPLLTETLKQARLLASKLSQNADPLDVSAIEKVTQSQPADLSVSLLPSVPTIEEKSIVSTISDKTFVKSSATDFSSEDEDETIVEPSYTNDPRPLLFTADRSIRRPLDSIVENEQSPRSFLHETICPPVVLVEKIAVKPPRMSRMLREIQLDENPPIELPTKTRYATRASTRLATADARRRTTRYQSE